MIRLFHVYFPVRMLVLLIGEGMVVCSSFVVATLLLVGSDSYITLNYENGFLKILLVTGIAMLCSYYFDLYAPSLLQSSGEIYFRLLVLLSVLSFLVAGLMYVFPGLEIGRNVFLYGMMILTVLLFAWRSSYDWLIRQPFLRERVYVLGAGERAQLVVQAIREHDDWGMEVVGWAGAIGNGSITREDLAEAVVKYADRRRVDRIVVAVADRRGTLPVRELLNLRVTGVVIEEAGSLLEKTSGCIEVDDLHPSALIYAEGFRHHASLMFARRLVSIVFSLIGLLCCLPLIPLIALAIKIDSDGPVFFSQERVGRRGKCFRVHKFRTMCRDAEAKGAQWAGTNDSRITRVGHFLRKTRLDEVPQLWNVLSGDMGFVGPRPERPEFVQWLTEAIPYYNLRHIIRPGLTGWAQVRYEYGATLEQSKEKLKYDLYYIKHMSVSLDLLIVFETIKTVLLRKGSR